MNLLSIGASLGVIVAIFQWGWLGGVFGVTGPIEAFIPVILFAIVFGLSMDYEVFIVSRIHEEWSADVTRPPPSTTASAPQARDHGGGHDHDLRLRVVRAR